jgi:ROS/MUCR transcriptional regulator protein
VDEPPDRSSPGLHALPGELPVSDDGSQVQCHLCGRWFRALGTHLRYIHEVTVEEYRVIAQLRPRRPLEAPATLEGRAARMRRMIATDERVQKGMAKGVGLARTGELQRQAEVLRRERPQTAETRKLLAEGAREINRRRGETYLRKREQRAHELGFESLKDLYSRRYRQDQARIQDLAQELGCAINAVRGDLKRLGLGPDPTRSHGARWRQSQQA